MTTFSVGWYGPGFSYYYTPTYNWDEGLNGIYLRRDMPDYQTHSPDPWNLKLKIVDLCDLSEADAFYIVHLHHPFDEWEETDAHYVYEPETIVFRGSVACVPGGTVTLSESCQSTHTHTTSISISPSFDFPISFPYVKMPLATTVGYTDTKTETFAVGASSTFYAPPDAASATFYTIWKVMMEYGHGNKYDEGGCLEKDSPATETDRLNHVCELRVEFYDSTGHDLGIPGYPW